MLLVLKTECAEGLRRDCRGAEAGPQGGRRLLRCCPGPAVVGWTCGGKVLRRVHRFQEAQDRSGSNAGPLRLRIMPGPGHHHDLCAQRAGDPVSLRPRLGEVGVLLAITTRAGAVTSASRASARSWLVRVVRENAFA